MYEGLIKYDHEKVINKLLDNYHEKYGNGKPTKTMENLIDCLDDAFMDEWVKSISEIGDNLCLEALKVQEEAHSTLKAIKDSIVKNEETAETAKQATGVNDERVADALKAYQVIVNMEFETAQQKLQNIQNASYFIWALYAKESSTASMFLNHITDVKKESDAIKLDEWEKRKKKARSFD